MGNRQFEFWFFVSRARKFKRTHELISTATQRRRTGSAAAIERMLRKSKTEVTILRRIVMALLLATFVLLSASSGVAQSKAIDPGARKDIDAGNQAWVDGMKSGDVAVVAASFAENALSCGPSGECEKGRAAIEASLKERVAKTGRAVSATVTSEGSVQRGDFVYEWGESWATYPGGGKRGGHYLTVWERERDGKWRIYRNLGMPAGSKK
jgi:uncharacterized protein (TIGR02246 family)